MQGVVSVEGAGLKGCNHAIISHHSHEDIVSVFAGPSGGVFVGCGDIGVQRHGVLRLWQGLALELSTKTFMTNLLILSTSNINKVITNIIRVTTNITQVTTNITKVTTNITQLLILLK